MTNGTTPINRKAGRKAQTERSRQYELQGVGLLPAQRRATTRAGLRRRAAISDWLAPRSAHCESLRWPPGPGRVQPDAMPLPVRHRSRAQLQSAANPSPRLLVATAATASTARIGAAPPEGRQPTDRRQLATPRCRSRCRATSLAAGSEFNQRRKARPHTAPDDQPNESPDEHSGGYAKEHESKPTPRSLGGSALSAWRAWLANAAIDDDCIDQGDVRARLRHRQFRPPISVKMSRFTTGTSARLFAPVG